MEWYLVKDELPQVGQEVLCAYRIGESKYYCTGRIEEIRETKTKTGVTKSIDWLDSENNSFNPELWTPIKTPPLYKEKEEVGLE